MPTPTIQWAFDQGGDWATTFNWSPHRLPNSTDDVAIDTANVRVVTHSIGTSTVHSLTVGNDFFTVSGGSLRINSTSSFAILLTVSGGTMRFGGAATAALFRQSGGTVRGAGTLTVTGQTTFASTLLETGAGRTLLKGDSAFNGVSGDVFGVDGGRTVENQGALTLSGFAKIVLGLNPFGASLGGGTMKNDAAGTIDMQDNSEISSIAGGATSFINAGTLKKTGGTALSIIRVDTTDTGSIEAANGTLEFLNPITGDGSLVVDTGAALEVKASAAATLKMTFNGGTLALGDPASFAATIHAFGAGDTIDLVFRQATKATLGAGDTLVIKNGTTTIATLQLAGNHAGDTFHVASDGHAGTLITVTPGPAHVAPFVAAMAGLGAGDGGGPVLVFSEAHYTHPPMLSAPRMAMA